MSGVLKDRSVEQGGPWLVVLDGRFLVGVATSPASIGRLRKRVDGLEGEHAIRLVESTPEALAILPSWPGLPASPPAVSASSPSTPAAAEASAKPTSGRASGGSAASQPQRAGSRRS